MKAFSLIEMIVVIAIIGLLATISFPVYKTFQAQNNLAIAKNNVIKALREAQQAASASKNDSAWGVNLLSGQAIIFQGQSYITRLASQDIILELPSDISLGGDLELVFNKFSGELNAPAAITLSNGGNSKIINLNQKGAISF